jgi:pachytene checkpoint protein 2
MAEVSLPPGVLSMHVLPADHHDKDWDAIIVPAAVKERLLAQALVTLKHGRKLSQLAGLPHGLIVLAGPPGTGKTTLGRGLAQVAALALAKEGATTLLEINPHAFPSDMLGESQRNIMRLLQDTIPEIAARRPHTVVLIDEVESFAVRRTSASFETNPVDVHRATDAVMLGIDAIAKNLPSVLFVTTTNFIDAIDDAFLSRADLVMHFALPKVETIASILRHSLEELAVQWPQLRPLSAMKEIDEVARLCEGWNGRQVRKLILAALAQRLEVAKDPAKLTLDDLREAARKRGGVEWAGDAAPSSKELFGDVPAELKHDHDHGHGEDHDHHHPKTRRIR